MSDQQVRQRKGKRLGKSSKAEKSAPSKPGSLGDGVVGDSNTEEEKQILWRFLGAVNLIMGLVVMAALAAKYCQFLQTVHENNLWFSNIKVWKSSSPLSSENTT